MTLLPGPPLDEDGPVYTVIVLIDHGVIVQSTRASRQRPSIQCRPVTHDIAKARATINAKHWLDLKLTTYTPYLTLTGELWFVYCERIICGIMVPIYGDFILYLQPCGRVTVSQWLKHFLWYHEVPGPWFNIQMSSYQCRKSHCGDKTILRPSYLHNGISYTGKLHLYILPGPWIWGNSHCYRAHYYTS